MFCYQCEQTAKGTGCTAGGVCGKDAQVSGLQDIIVHLAKGISLYAHKARLLGAKDASIDDLTQELLFTTLTNVNFDPDSLHQYIRRAAAARDRAKALYETAATKAAVTMESLSGPATWSPADDLPALTQQANEVGLDKGIAALGADVAGLQNLILFGLKGVAAYLYHAQVLGYREDALYARVHEALAFLAADPKDITALLGKALEVGETNLKAMELLDRANTETYGHPTPTVVRVEPLKGKAILVSGHDLKDLEELLKQTQGKGISVYTHGEMLPALAYPKLKAYKHLAGNYGGAWQDQRKEFDQFPGAILMTTNCIQRPTDGYKGRIFTSGPVAWPGVSHIQGHAYAPLIEAALKAPGFAADGPDKTITIGFGRNAVLSVADKVIAAVKAGQIRHFFLVGGCDGAKPGRNYYTELVQAVPKDCVILTLACGKYRFNKLDFGDIGGIPRLLDIGQCNDAYSAIQIAVALAGAFGCGVNDLPLSMILSWYEQKACSILLTLLHLGIKGIRLGPSLPAFVTPAALNVLVEKFAIAPISTPEQDLAAILKR